MGVQYKEISMRALSTDVQGKNGMHVADRNELGGLSFAMYVTLNTTV